MSTQKLIKQALNCLEQGMTEHPIGSSEASDCYNRAACLLKRALGYNKPRIYFRDIATGKRRYTMGQFIKWQRGGILNTFGAVIERSASVLFIPRYLIEKATLATLPPLPEGATE